MLVSLSIKNFRSFSQEQTFSLVASARLSGSHDDHKVPIPATSESVLRAAVIYGANGAGKSNLFKALRFAKRLAIGTRPKTASTGREAFRFDETSTGPSSIDIQLIAGGTVYRYGFNVDDTSVAEEWLVKLIGNRERTLYERITGPDGKVTIETPGFKATDKVAVLASLGGPPNQTFLATVGATLDREDLNKDVRSVIEWFSDSLRLIGPTESIEPVGHLLSTDPKFLAFAGEFLKRASTGVDHLQVEKVEVAESDLAKLLPKSLMDRVLKGLEDDEDGIAVVQVGESVELLVERKDANHFYRIAIQAAHGEPGSTSKTLNLADESDGTRRLLQLMPALHKAKNSEVVYFIDEIDRSLHPMLIWKFVDAFIRSCLAIQSQIIVTTHESNLLDLELLRRDEVWFVEKDASLTSHLYSLMDFKIRKDLEVRKHYLQGRFGAVPFLGNVDRLIEEAAS